MIKCSFVVPTHNTAAWLPHAVQSVFEQSQPDCELIIVNDASTDSTKDYLDWLMKQKTPVPVQIMDCKENVGRSKARNIGNKMAQGNIILVLDADDVAHPDRAKMTLARMNRGYGFVHGSAEAMDFSGRKLHDLPASEFDLRTALEKKENRIVHSTVAYTKEVAEKFPYCQDDDISKNGLDDWKQQLDIATGGVKMGVIVSPIGAYRVLDSAISAQRDHKKVQEIKEKYLAQYLQTA